MSQSKVLQRDVIGSWKKALDHCGMAMADGKTESISPLFLSSKNTLIGDAKQLLRLRQPHVDLSPRGGEVGEGTERHCDHHSS